MLGIVERVEARVDSVVTVILILIEEGVTGDRFNCVPTFGSDQLDAKGFDVDAFGRSCGCIVFRISPVDKVVIPAVEEGAFESPSVTISKSRRVRGFDWFHGRGRGYS